MDRLLTVMVSAVEARCLSQQRKAESKEAALRNTCGRAGKDKSQPPTSSGCT